MQNDGERPAQAVDPKQMSSPVSDPIPSGGLDQPAIKDPAKLLRPAKIFVLLGLALSVLSVGSDALELQLWTKVENHAFATDEEMIAAADANDLRQVFIGVPYLIVLLLAFIFVGRWIYFSAKNVRAFGATDLTIRPGWAVGWYFVPIANLWKPYQAMKEICQSSSEPLDWQTQKTTGLMPLWWTLWIITNFADRATFRLTNNAETIGELQAAATVSIASGCLNIVLSIVFVILITRISQLQIHAMEHKTTVAVFGP